MNESYVFFQSFNIFTGLSISLNRVSSQLTYYNVHICVQIALASAQSNPEIQIFYTLNTSKYE